jgi:hypothetical protein
MINFLRAKGNSRLQEKMAEYAFLRDLIIDGVRNKVKLLISRSDFDEFGYDVLVQIEGRETLTKLQLKAYNGKANNWDVQKSLIVDVNANVVLIRIQEANGVLHFSYRTLVKADRDRIIKRPPKKKNPRNCKLNIGDSENIGQNEMLVKILNFNR